MSDCTVPTGDKNEYDTCKNLNVNSSLGYASHDSGSVDCNGDDSCTLNLDAFFENKPIVIDAHSCADVPSMLMVMGGNASFNDGGL